MGEGVQQGGSSPRHEEVHAPERASALLAKKMDRGANVFLAPSKQEDEQRLRAAAAERRRSFHLRCDESSDGEEIGPLMRLSGRFLHALGCINARKPASVAAFLRPGLSYPSQTPDRRSAYCQLGGHLALAVKKYRRGRTRSPERSPNGKVPVHYYWGVEPHDFVCLFGTSRDEQEPGSILWHLLLPLPYVGWS